jgi:3-deoxy-D-manno-octulosonate 8-phosphate phosphatase (KDO 8-P phosphatase)
MTHCATSEILERAQAIQLILMDCDGVLTDGRIILLPDGEEIKNFHVLDGQGVALAREAGLRVGVITGRVSRVLEKRATENRFDFIWQKADDKLAAFNSIVEQAGLSKEQVTFIGDDLPDIPLMRRAGLSIAVANAVDDVKAVAQLVTRRAGGDGAVREAIEFILRAQSRWERVLGRYLI